MPRRRPHSCIDPQCSYCNDRAAAIELERDYPEPMSPGEEARLDNAYERAMWGDL